MPDYGLGRCKCTTTWTLTRSSANAKRTSAKNKCCDNLKHLLYCSIYLGLLSMTPHLSNAIEVADIVTAPLHFSDYFSGRNQSVWLLIRSLQCRQFVTVKTDDFATTDWTSHYGLCSCRDFVRIDRWPIHSRVTVGVILTIRHANCHCVIPVIGRLFAVAGTIILGL